MSLPCCKKLFSLMVPALLFACATQATAQQPSYEMLAQLKRAVVIVTTYDSEGNALLQGSGFFISPQRVVTNLHVINQASHIRIETFSGQTIPVISVAATDLTSDLALLQINAAHPDTDILQVEYNTPDEGEAIFVLSNPQGFRWKTTLGRVGTMWAMAGSGRRLQITAILRPGSSGGPVLNQQGRVVGIANMHIWSGDGLDFAVPSADLKALQATASAAISRPAAPGRKRKSIARQSSAPHRSHH